jgi:hypothetical protein
MISIRFTALILKTETILVPENAFSSEYNGGERDVGSYHRDRSSDRAGEMHGRRNHSVDGGAHDYPAVAVERTWQLSRWRQWWTRWLGQSGDPRWRWRRHSGRKAAVAEEDVDIM